MTVRVYLPVTAADLVALVSERRLPGPRAAHAVTASLRAHWPEADDEEAEYAALMAAAADSRTDAAGERRVLAADVPEVAESTRDQVTAVEVPGGVAWGQLAAVHVDLAADAADDDDLAWYAVQELPGLL